MGQPSQILRIGVEGGKASAVFAENRGQIDANWSADGQKMVFGYMAGAANLSISLLDLKAQKVTTIPGSEGLFSPRWSPDGRYIAALSPDFTKVMLFDFKTQQWSTWLAEPAELRSIIRCGRATASRFISTTWLRMRNRFAK